MSPRLGALAAVLVAPALPMLVSTPAHAAIGTICVGPVPAGTPCNTAAPTIQSAIAASTAGDTIRVGSGTYVDGPYTLKANTNLRGNGAGISASATVIQTVVTTPPTPTSQTFVTAGQGSTIADLRVDMRNGSAATGVLAGNASTVDNVVVFASGSTNSIGISATGGATLRDSTVNMVGSATGQGVRSTGGNILVSQSTWNGGGSGYVLAGPTDVSADVVRQITVNGEGDAVRVERGTLTIDDSVLDLGSVGSRGLYARPWDGAGATIEAYNLTIVRGAAGAKGVVADSSGSANRTATINVRNTIVRTTGAAFDRTSGAGTATIAVSNSTYLGDLPNGVANAGNNLPNADPQFINPAGDYHLRGTSPMVDRGVSYGQAPNDRDGKARIDGNRDGTPQPDIGAYELTDFTAPTTTFTAGPSGPTNVKVPSFAWRSENGATFECSVDGQPFFSCASPLAVAGLAEGAHQFSVRARDAVFNVENPPATRVFVIDTIAPDATITKKPAKRFYKKKVKFKFAVSEPGAKLQCNLDGRGWKACNFKWKFNTKVGKHKLLVRAVDAAGNIDPTPAKYGYKRLAPKKR